MIVMGTRPEIIRLCRVVEKLDQLCDLSLVHTGQNYDSGLKDVFFAELGMRAPDHDLGVKANTFGAQAGQMLEAIERLLQHERPDKLLILGDTNSGLCAFVAKRMGIPVYHMEAGNRCYDDRVPEEVNRRIIDHSSDVLMPYSERSRQNLLREGIPGERIFVTGNPILEVLEYYRDRIRASQVLQGLRLEENRYFLVTMHRAENVDLEPRLRSLTDALARLVQKYEIPVIVSTHPRTRSKMQTFGILSEGNGVVFNEPFGFFDFVHLEQRARCVISDSGTVQEECAIFGVANVTIRDVTERPETLECGSNILAGGDAETIVRCVQTLDHLAAAWIAPPEYLVRNVSDTVLKILLGYLHPPRSPEDRK